MRRVFSLLVVLSMALGSAGCGGGNDIEKPENTPPPPSGDPAGLEPPPSSDAG